MVFFITGLHDLTFAFSITRLHGIRAVHSQAAGAGLPVFDESRVSRVHGYHQKKQSFERGAREDPQTATSHDSD